MSSGADCLRTLWTIEPAIRMDLNLTGCQPIGR